MQAYLKASVSEMASVSRLYCIGPEKQFLACPLLLKGDFPRALQPFVYSSHSISSLCFLAVLHSLQAGTTLPLVLLPPRTIGTM